jgi:hypothetical protein
MIISIQFIFFLSSYTLSQEQVREGVYRIGGGIWFSSSNTDNKNNGNNKSISLSISPQFAYFLIDNLELGGSLSYYYDEYSYKQPGWENSNVYSGYSLGPRIRYYASSDKFIPFIEASFKYELYGTHGSDKIATKRFDFVIGLDYFLTSYAAIEPSVFYEFMKGDEETGRNIWIGMSMSYFITD